MKLFYKIVRHFLKKSDLNYKILLIIIVIYNYIYHIKIEVIFIHKVIEFSDVIVGNEQFHTCAVCLLNLLCPGAWTRA